MPRATVSSTRFVPRDVRFSISFPSAVGDYVEVGDVYAFERTDTFSCCGYFKATSFGATNMSLIRKSSTVTSNAQGWAVLIDTASRQMSFFMSSNSATIRINQPLLATIELNKWYFWALSYDGSATAAGVQMICIPLGTALTAFNTKDAPVNDNLTSGSTVNSQFLCIGRASNSARQFFGNQTKTSVFTAALSLADFQNIYYNNTYPASLGSTWSGEAATGSGTVEDEVGTFDGTLQGLAAWSSETPFLKRATSSARSAALARTTAV